MTRTRARRLEHNSHTELHIGGLKLCLAVPDPYQYPGQRLYRAARRGAPHGDAKLREKRFTGNGELQLLLPDLEIVGAVHTSITRRIRLANGKAGCGLSQ
jgi:hypothetical protein